MNSAVYAQIPLADSLFTEVSKHPKRDTTKVKLLIQLSAAYYHVNGDSQLKYAYKALDIADNLGYSKLSSNAHMQLGASFYSTNQIDSALKHYNTSMAICHEHGYLDMVASRQNAIGNIHLRYADFIQALEYYDSAVLYAEKYDNTLALARARSNVATVYYEQGSYTAALKNYLEALDIHERLNSNNDIESSYLNITNVYFRLGDYEKAREYAAKAQELSKTSGTKHNAISINTTFAMIFNEQKMYDSSLHYLEQAYDDAQVLNNSFITNLLKANIAECYTNMGMLDTAYKLYLESLITSRRIKDIEGVAEAKGGLGRILVQQGRKFAGLKYMKEALEILQEKNMREQCMAITGRLADAYQGIGDYKNALLYYQMQNAYQDTLAKEDALKSARTIEFDYILNKKEAEIELLQKDKLIELSKLKLQRTITISAVIGLLLASLIAILVFRNLRLAKYNTQLILQQKSEIEQQAKELREMNNFKDVTFSVLSHDLRSPINALTGTMSLLDEGIITPEEFTEHKNELNNKLQSVNLMLDNLLQWAKSQMKGEHTLEIEKISVRMKTLRTFAVLKDAASQKDIALTTDIPENIFVHADRNQLAMVMRNLVSNAIKFTPKGGTVKIDAEQAGDHVKIMVTDSGVGMSAEQATRLFDGKPNESTHGTGGEKGTGIGLQLSYNFIVSNGGNLTVDSREGSGSTFTITLPA